VARLSSIESKKTQVRFGLLKGKVRISADFDDPLPEG
jgi:hypothetical protein